MFFVPPLLLLLCCKSSEFWNHCDSWLCTWNGWQPGRELLPGIPDMFGSSNEEWVNMFFQGSMLHLSRTLRWRELHPFSHIASRNHISKCRSSIRCPGSPKNLSLCCSTSGNEKCFYSYSQPVLVAKTLGEFQLWSCLSLTSSVLLHLCTVAEGHNEEHCCLPVFWWQ